MQAPLFDRFGGLPAVSRLVLDFYDRVLASERLKPYFARADMRRLVEHQAKFVAAVMNGPASYSDAQLKDIHSHLGIEPEAFEEMIGLFREALSEFEISAADAEQVVAELRRRRAYVVAARED